MEQILAGLLARFAVPDLLVFLNISERTGVLVLEHEDGETKIFLREGRPIFATSNREELRLGAVLVRAGKLDRRRMDKLLLQQRGGRNRIGQILMAEKLLKPDELASLLKVQVSEVIFDSFTWHDGAFTFYDRVPPPATAVTLEMELPNLILEGLRRIDERERLPSLFPDLNVVVEALVNPERVKNTVALTREEWQVFFLVDGRRSLSEICRLAGNPDEQATLLVVHNLLAAKFVARGAVAVPEAAEAAAAAAGGAEGTQKVVEDRPAPSSLSASVSVSVEFNPTPVAVKPEDDTKEIVRPQAQPYMAKSGKLTVSRLVMVQGDQENSFPLVRDTYTLGRHRNNDIVINDPKVSSFHARIDRSPDGFVLVDLKSRNGSFVNGKRIARGVLATGDEVRLGTARLLYKVDYTSSAHTPV
jgi:hypothetical protein